MKISSWLLAATYATVILAASRSLLYSFFRYGSDNIVSSAIVLGLVSFVFLFLHLWRGRVEEESEKWVLARERFEAICGLRPEEPQTPENREKVRVQVDALHASLDNAIALIASLEAQDVLTREYAEACKEIRRKQLRELLNLTRKFNWI
jgi:hypothetical protein